MKTSPELQKAVADYQKGSVEAFNTLYEQSYKYLHTCVIHVVKNEDMAMDMLQETYLEISKSISQLKSTEDFLSWAAMIANRKCFAHLKKQKDTLLDGSGLGDLDAEDSVSDYFENIADNEEFIPEEVLQDREKQRLIKEIIDGLNDMQRLCVIGFYYNEQKQEEIAEELGIPVNTVKSHLNRAKVKIKEAVVELDVKKGTRLYSFAPFMVLFFNLEAEACKVTAISSELMAAVNASVNATGTATQTAGIASKLVGMTMKAKVLIGVGIIGTAVIAGTAIAHSAKNKEELVVDVITESQEDEAVTQYENDEAEEPLSSMEAVDTSETVLEDSDLVEHVEGDYLAISGEYTYHGIANCGLIPVYKEGHWGLVNYNNEIIVPFEYDGACDIVNDEGYSFFAKDGTYYVFDKDGNELFSTDRSIKSISEGVVFASDGYDFDATFAYYNVDGSVIYESDNDFVDDKGGSAFHEGYAYFTDLELVRMDKSGVTESITELVYPSNPPSGKWVVTINGETNTYEPSWATILSVPVGAFNDGYYLERGHVASADTPGIYTLRNVEGTTLYNWDISTIFNRNELSFSVSDARWDFAGFWEDGVYCINHDTIMCAYISMEDKTKYYLVDLSKLPARGFEEYEATEGYYSNGEFLEYEYGDYSIWDFDFTILTDDALLCEADYIGFGNEIYWLISQNEKWGYIDHNGNVMEMYDDAAGFYNGKALVIEDGIAYVIDENFTKIKELEPAESVSRCGEVFILTSEDGTVKKWINLNDIM